MNKQEGGASILFLGMLALLLIGLKAAGAIAWSWLWVLSPIWMPIVLITLLVFIAHWDIDA
jgi:sterol desaturase/sphingolipid hydroxylase (fatty acid hydroxylase superfamily)